MAAVKRSLCIRQANYNLFEIYWQGGGGVPDMLKGSFTSLGEAQIKLEGFYLDKEANVAASPYKTKKKPTPNKE